MVHTVHNIFYKNGKADDHNKLDIYYSSKDAFRDVVVFIHGGSWKSGNKSTFKYLGRNFVRKGVVAVIINYSLYPNTIETMAQDCTSAVVWIHQNIAKYGGNPNRIFLMGYSSGGHLAEFINSNPEFFDQYHIPNPIHGIILLDAFGLDIFECLSGPSCIKTKHYNKLIKVFSNDPQHWNQVSAMKYRQNIQNPHLFLIGGRTYPWIQSQNKRLFGSLTASQQAPAELYEIAHRNHAEMIIYMLLRKKQQYDIISSFMKRN